MSKHPFDLLEMDHAAFKATGNPMHAWAAYATARVNNVPAPEWVLKYFDSIARELLRLSHQASERGAKDLAPEIAKGMGLKGAALKGYHRDEMIFALNVRTRVKRDGTGAVDAAVLEVAEAANVSSSTVWRAWVKYKDHLPDED